LKIAVVDVTKKWANLRTQCQKEYNGLRKKKPSGSGNDDNGESKWRYYRL